jgi:hypothetical protein
MIHLVSSLTKDEFVYEGEFRRLRAPLVHGLLVPGEFPSSQNAIADQFPLGVILTHLKEWS